MRLALGDGRWIGTTEFLDLERKCAAQASQIAALEERKQYLETHMKTASGERMELHDTVAALEAEADSLRKMLRSSFDTGVRTARDRDAQIANFDGLAPFVALAKAVDAFEKKLTLLQPAIDGAFGFQQIHGFPYQGENYGLEIIALRVALAHPAVQRAVKETG